ncbi:MAG: hypothetical protein AAGF76_04545 [Pseudomonadota bacterium]
MVEPLTRHKPDPIPAIHPLPERLARGRRQAFYEDTKAVLQVPWMGVVTMAFAHYPRFYETLWTGLRPLAASAPFVAACGQLRARTEDCAAALEPAPIGAALSERGYDAGEIAEIRALIEVFSHGNMPYLLIATQARLLLAGRALSPEMAAPAFAGRHGPEPGRALTLIEPHHADESLAALYADIRTTLGLPFVNTDYRALARWPSYLALAWADLRTRIGTEPYEAAVGAVHQEAMRLASTLPNPGGLSAETLRAAAEADGSAVAISETVALFQWLLPGLVTNVAFLRAQITAPATSASA